MRPHTLTLVATMVVAAATVQHDVTAAARPTITIRGHQEPLYAVGNPGGQPVILSSGDGGWVHLAPHVAALLSSHGYDVIGFDTRGYLESFSSNGAGVSEADVQRDYRDLVRYAAGRSRTRPILMGVSEGAGLSVLAATSPELKTAVAGVVALGLSNTNELAWRWRDAVIYVTHGTPREPAFRVDDVIGGVSPLPLAAIHATHDEFSPLGDVERVMASAHEPRRLWTIPASNHRFSDNLDGFDRSVLEALAWVNADGRH